MKNKLDVLFSFSIYGLGLLAMVLSDILVSQNTDANYIADWAFLKSSILITGGICLLGYDFTFVRDPSLIKRVFPAFSLQSVIIGFVVAAVLFYIKDFTLIKGTTLFFNILLYSLLLFLAAGARANFNLTKSQFSTNFWKFILLVLLVLFPDQSLVLVFLVSIAINIVISYFLKGFLPASGAPLVEKLSKTDARKIGMSYLLYNLTLTLSIYGEQFLINLDGDVTCSGHLFKYFAIFTPIALSVNGFLGFYFGPKFRIENNMNLTKFNRFAIQIGVFSFVITLISAVSGLFFMHYFFKMPFDQIDYIIITGLSLMCLIRGFYTTSSVCLGVFASAKIIQRIAYYNWGYFILYSIAMLICLYYSDGYEAARYISILSFVHWLLRSVTATRYSRMVVKTLNND